MIDTFLENQTSNLASQPQKDTNKTATGMVIHSHAARIVNKTVYIKIHVIIVKF
jgi:hypothetical protein